jgi:hypothetical protein
VKLLIARGARLDVTHNGETPLELALRAQTDVSEWTPHASDAIVTALRTAGAS